MNLKELKELADEHAKALTFGMGGVRWQDSPEAPATVLRLIAALEKAEGALNDVLYHHANDNLRPRAFYIASSALAEIRELEK